MLEPNRPDELDEEEEEEDDDDDDAFCDWLNNGRDLSRWVATTARWIGGRDFLTDSGENIRVFDQEKEKGFEDYLIDK